MVKWENLDKSRQDSRHYSVIRLASDNGMDALREIFPNAEANDMNFVIFSTSGVHGSYNTIEDAEKFLKSEDDESNNEVTFLIVHPRLVTLRYSVCNPENQDDIDYLKKLRESSKKAVMNYFKAHL